MFCVDSLFLFIVLCWVITTVAVPSPIYIELIYYSTKLINCTLDDQKADADKLKTK